MQRHLSTTDPPIKARVNPDGDIEVTLRSGTVIIQPANPRMSSSVRKADRTDLDLAMLVSSIENAKAVWFHEGNGEDVFGTIYAHGDDVMVELHLMSPGFRKQALAAVNKLIKSPQIVAGNWPEC